MKYKYSIKIIIIIIPILFLFNACTPSTLPVSKGGYYHSGIYFGAHLSNAYTRGIEDGCTTSKGDYKKSHWLFQNKNDYVDGWFLGRNKCRNLLVLDED